MSEENVELVRRCYERFSTVAGADVEEFDLERMDPGLWARIDPDLELHERPDLPDAKVYRGREEAKEFFRKTWEIFSEVRWELLELIDRGDVVITLNRVVGTGRGSDVRVKMDEANVFWFRDGMLVRLAGFATREEALAAAGDDPDTA